MANSIVKTSLPEYVNQHTSELLIKAMTGARTLRHIEQMLGVKGATTLNVLNSSVVFGDGKECGFNAQGADTLTQRALNAVPIKIEKEWCARSLADTYLNHQLRWEAGSEVMPFEEKFIDSNIAEIAAELDKAIWQGNDSLGLDGFIDLATASGSGIVTASANNIVAAVNAVYAKIPTEALQRGAVIFLSDTNFRAYVAALNAECCGARIIDASAGEILYGGDSRVTIVGVGGLEGTNYIVGSAKDNLVYGTDIRDSHATFDVWFSKDNGAFRFLVLFTAGVQYKFPDEFVLGTITA